MTLTVSLEQEDWEWLVDFMKKTLDYVDDEPLDEDAIQDLTRFINIFERVLRD